MPTQVLQTLLANLLQPAPAPPSTLPMSTLLAALQQQGVVAPAPQSRHLSLEPPGAQVGAQQLLAQALLGMGRGAAPTVGLQRGSVTSASMPEQLHLEQLLALLQQQPPQQ